MPGKRKPSRRSAKGSSNSHLGEPLYYWNIQMPKRCGDATKFQPYIQAWRELSSSTHRTEVGAPMKIELIRTHRIVGVIGDYPSLRVVTKDNETFYLIGDRCNESDHGLNGSGRYSDALLERFKNGFPSDWKQICREAYELHLAERNTPAGAGKSLVKFTCSRLSKFVGRIKKSVFIFADVNASPSGSDPLPDCEPNGEELAPESPVVSVAVASPIVRSSTDNEGQLVHAVERVALIPNGVRKVILI